MQFNYKPYPVQNPDPAFPHEKFAWYPVIQVRLNHQLKHTTTPRFEAWVDSGSPYCYFHASIGRKLGIKIENGTESSLGGIIKGPPAKIYFHGIGVYVGADLIRIKAGFCDELSVAGILGRNGFFDNFVVTFNQSTTTPFVELQKINNR